MYEWHKRNEKMCKRYFRKRILFLVGMSINGFCIKVAAADSFRSLPSILNARNLPIVRRRKLLNSKSDVILCSTAVKKKKKNTGFYYGLSEEYLTLKKRQDEDLKDDNVDKFYEKTQKKSPKPKTRQKSEPLSMQDVLGDTLSEFKTTSEDLRDTLEAIRQEMRELARMQRKLMEQQTGGKVYLGDDENNEESTFELSPAARRKQLKKRKENFDKLAVEVERWATHLLFEQGVEEDGWKDIECSKLLSKKFNKEGKIKCFLKWLPDSRGNQAESDDDKEYPCMRCYTTIDAPLEHVCQYLSKEETMKEYNDLVVKHKDLEDISPHSKICWGQCPQILFIKPRDFVTFCHHRWKKDGTQIVVNQAVQHDDAPAVLEEGKGNVCRAYAIRGANFLSRDPSDPNKTRMAILAHGNPGGNLPTWATKAAVNAVVQIEPFKLFHNIEKGIKETPFDETSMESVTSSSGVAGRSSQPGGLSQLGYACFWPNGGGIKEHDEVSIDE